MTLPYTGFLVAVPTFGAVLSDGTGGQMLVNLLTVVRGSDRTFRLLVTDNDGNPVDLTGATLYFTVKDGLSATAITILTKTSASSAQIAIQNQLVPATKGMALIYLVPTDTATQAPGQYYYDAWLKTVDGKKVDLLPPSTFEIRAAVTTVP